MPKLSLCFIGLFTGLLFSLTAHAQSNCNCGPEMDFQQQVEQANVIVLGKVLKVTTNPIKGGLNIVFDVDSSWNRRIEHTATFHTNSAGQCGYRFEEGKQYLVFGKKRHQTIGTSICEPNLLYSEGGEGVVRRLGQGYAPGRPEMALKMNWILLALGLGGILLVAFVVLRKKIRPS